MISQLQRRAWALDQYHKKEYLFSEDINSYRSSKLNPNGNILITYDSLPDLDLTWDDIVSLRELMREKFWMPDWWTQEIKEIYDKIVRANEEFEISDIRYPFSYTLSWSDRETLASMLVGERELLMMTNRTWAVVERFASRLKNILLSPFRVITWWKNTSTIWEIAVEAA